MKSVSVFFSAAAVLVVLAAATPSGVPEAVAANAAQACYCNACPARVAWPKMTQQLRTTGITCTP